MTRRRAILRSIARWGSVVLFLGYWFAFGNACLSVEAKRKAKAKHHLSARTTLAKERPPLRRSKRRD